jgi:hypothetical protein
LISKPVPIEITLKKKIELQNKDSSNPNPIDNQCNARRSLPSVGFRLITQVMDCIANKAGDN